jgi:hypothetical protein
MVERLLRVRFGELPSASLDRVANASADELDRWAERLLDAGSLEQLFAGE